MAVCRHTNSHVKSKSLASQAVPLSQARSGCAPGTGQDGTLLYPAPLCGGESGTTGTEGGIDMDVDSCSSGQDALSKSPAPAHGLAAHEWAASAKRGGLLLYSGHPAFRPSGRLRRSRRSCGAVVAFLLATQEKSDSAATGRRKLFALMPKCRKGRSDDQLRC